MNEQKQARRWLYALGLLALSGCAIGRPYPYWADVGREWGCDPLTVQRENIEYSRARRGVGEQVEIQVGWDACEMLARAGAPSDYTGIFTTGRPEYSLVFPNSSGQPPQLVTIGQDRQGVWRVTAVNY